MSGSFVSPGIRAKVRGLAEPVGRLFVRLGLSPNAIAVIGFGIVMLVCVLASTLAIRAALRVDPAAAIGG